VVSSLPAWKDRGVEADGAIRQPTTVAGRDSHGRPQVWSGHPSFLNTTPFHFSTSLTKALRKPRAELHSGSPAGSHSLNNPTHRLRRLSALTRPHPAWRGLLRGCRSRAGSLRRWSTDTLRSRHASKLCPLALERQTSSGPEHQAAKAAANYGFVASASFSNIFESDHV